MVERDELGFHRGLRQPAGGIFAERAWRRSQTNFEEANTWTKILGNHTIKWGVDLESRAQRPAADPDFDPARPVQFRRRARLPHRPGQRTANAFAAFLLDLPNQVGRDLYVEFPTVRQSYYYFFGQDKWVVSRKLTLDLGLRYEFWPAATSHYDGQFVNYDPSR